MGSGVVPRARGPVNEEVSDAETLRFEDRRALEMNLTGERGASKMWEQTAIEPREENERLRRQVGGAPEPAAQSPTGAG